MALGVSMLLALPAHDLVSAACQWDCGWHLSVARGGYFLTPFLIDPHTAGQANWAFFPLYPMLSGLLATLLGLSVEQAGMMLNIILWPVIIWLCGRDLRLRGIPFSPVLLPLAFVLYPLNVWYMAQYSEAVYGVMLMVCVTSLRARQVNVAALSCALLALARPTGFIMVICLAGWWTISSYSGEKAVKDRMADSLLLVAAGGAGLSLYVLYLFHVMGDGFAFAHVQIAWDRHFQLFFLTFLHNLMHLKHIGTCVLEVCICVVIWRMARAPGWRLNALLAGVTTLLAVTTGTDSIARYVFANPLTIEFLVCAVLTRPPPVRALVLSGMGLAHLWTTTLWFHTSGLLM